MLYQQPSGATPYLQQSNNNFNSPSADFQNLNQTIKNLDGEYDALPNQADWIIYAGNISGEWQLCANCAPGPSGKKLFRQYNFNRIALGLAQVTVPIDNTESAGSGPTEIHLTPNGGPPNFLFRYIWPSAMDGLTVIAQQGQQAGNPQYTLIAADNGQFVFAGPTWDFIQQVIAGVENPANPDFGSPVQHGCWFTANGAPGDSQAITIILDP